MATYFKFCLALFLVTIIFPRESLAYSLDISEDCNAGPAECYKAAKEDGLPAKIQHVSFIEGKDAKVFFAYSLDDKDKDVVWKKPEQKENERRGRVLAALPVIRIPQGTILGHRTKTDAPGPDAWYLKSFPGRYNGNIFTKVDLSDYGGVTDTHIRYKLTVDLDILSFGSAAGRGLVRNADTRKARSIAGVGSDAIQPIVYAGLTGFADTAEDELVLSYLVAWQYLEPLTYKKDTDAAEIAFTADQKKAMVTNRDKILSEKKAPADLLGAPIQLVPASLIPVAAAPTAPPPNALNPTDAAQKGGKLTEFLKKLFSKSKKAKN